MLFGILLAIALLLTLGVLFSGLIVMARGGEVARKYSNQLMRWRIIAQGVAIVILALAMAVA
ncbi:MAG: twin transmembrane helix small protein [Pseudomonadota bacterium]